MPLARPIRLWVANQVSPMRLSSLLDHRVLAPTRKASQRLLIRGINVLLSIKEAMTAIRRIRLLQNACRLPGENGIQKRF
jgi:hypothetical protein